MDPSIFLKRYASRVPLVSFDIKHHLYLKYQMITELTLYEFKMVSRTPERRMVLQQRRNCVRLSGATTCWTGNVKQQVVNPLSR
jgi:hypothetical protein